MTFRERMADWISGGALSKALGRIDELDLTACQLSDRAQKEKAYCDMFNTYAHEYCEALKGIMHATAKGKSGTTQKIHRMAKEALGE